LVLYPLSLEQIGKVLYEIDKADPLGDDNQKNGLLRGKR